MKRERLFFVFLLLFSSLFFYGCSSSCKADEAPAIEVSDSSENNFSEEPKPILHVVETKNGEYLADEN